MVVDCKICCRRPLTELSCKCLICLNLLEKMCFLFQKLKDFYCEVDPILISAIDEETEKNVLSILRIFIILKMCGSLLGDIKLYRTIWSFLLLNHKVDFPSLFFCFAQDSVR